MRKISFYLLASAFLLSCNDKDDNSSELTEIQLNAGIEATAVRSSLGPINNSFSIDFPIGVYANKGGTWSAGATNMINNDNATVSGTSPHNIQFTGTYYYPIDGTAVNIYAYAPYSATVSTAATAGSTSSNAPKVDITITGHDDVMQGSASGSKTEPITGLTFSHLLTQLQFTFVADAGFPTTAKVTSLKVIGQNNLVTLNVQSKECTFGGTATDMEAIAVSNTITITSSPGTDANSPIMIQPETPVNLAVTVQFSGGETYTYPNTLVPLTTAAGQAHKITITFKQTQISATASVTAWESGTAGNINLQ